MIKTRCRAMYSLMAVALCAPVVRGQSKPSQNNEHPPLGATRLLISLPWQRVITAPDGSIRIGQLVFSTGGRGTRAYTAATAACAVSRSSSSCIFGRTSSQDFRWSLSLLPGTTTRGRLCLTFGAGHADCEVMVLAADRVTPEAHLTMAFGAERWRSMLPMSVDPDAATTASEGSDVEANEDGTVGTNGPVAAAAAAFDDAEPVNHFPIERRIEGDSLWFATARSTGGLPPQSPQCAGCPSSVSAVINAARSITNRDTSIVGVWSADLDGETLIRTFRSDGTASQGVIGKGQPEFVYWYQVTPVYKNRVTVCDVRENPLRVTSSKVPHDPVGNAPVSCMIITLLPGPRSSDDQIGLGVIRLKRVTP
jgi:hypothetical protein